MTASPEHCNEPESFFEESSKNTAQVKLPSEYLTNLSISSDTQISQLSKKLHQRNWNRLFENTSYFTCKIYHIY